MSNMKGIFNTTIFQINVPSNNSKVKLIPFGDVHFGTENFAKDVWEEFTEKYAKKKNVYFLGMGDYVDFASTSERKGISGADLHSSTEDLFDTVAYKMIRDFKKTISFMGKKLIGLLGGNHYWHFRNDLTSDERLAQLTEVPYLGIVSCILLELKYPDGTVLNTNIFAAHGKGSGKLPGSAYNSVEDMTRYCSADVYLMGHDHSRGIIPGRARLEPVSVKQNGERKLLVKEHTPYL